MGRDRAGPLGRDGTGPIGRDGTGPMGRDRAGPLGRDGTGPGGGAGEGGVTSPLLQVLQVAPRVLKNTMHITKRKKSPPYN